MVGFLEVVPESLVLEEYVGGKSESGDDSKDRTEDSVNRVVFTLSNPTCVDAVSQVVLEEEGAFYNIPNTLDYVQSYTYKFLTTLHT